MSDSHPFAGLSDRLHHRLVDLPRLHKRILLIASDLLLLALALWLSLSFRYVDYYVPESGSVALVLMAAPLIGVGLLLHGGAYRSVTRYFGASATKGMLLWFALSVLVWALVVLLSGERSVPRSVLLLYGFIGATFIYASRRLAGFFLKLDSAPPPQEAVQRSAVAIYGAGQAGAQLLDSLRQGGNRAVAGFLDDAPSLVGQYIGGVKVYRPDKLETLVERRGVRQVFFAQASANRQEWARVLKWLHTHNVQVQVLPALDDLMSGRVTVNDLRPVRVEDLLSRDPVPPMPEPIDRAVKDKNVMVTGAGGSIGSELVRRLLRHQPRRLVLFELSEVALYEIDKEVRRTVALLPAEAPRPEIVAVLGSVADARIVTRTIEQNGIETICHAAAYKHVPLVEDNVAAAIDNNVFGTLVLTEVARKLGVQRFVLVSTDKTVRPTSVMGASKRVAELILQAHAADPACDCVFTMVRFGNVLDSSGSVMRLFRTQIEAGGPITVTHRDVVRYFMSIPEAAELVLQAAGMSKGGEVFLLDMGEPVRIDDLARAMIRVAGREVRDDANPDGDIAIEYTGLRPGEKLYEELLIGGNCQPTEHPRISRSDEPMLKADELAQELNALRRAMSEADVPAIKAILSRVVEGYRGLGPEEADKPGERLNEKVLWAPATRTLH